MGKKPKLILQVSEAGCCYLSLCPQAVVGNSRRQAADSKCQARAPAILLLECTGVPSCSPWKFVKLWGFTPNPTMGIQGCCLYPLPHARLAPVRALDLLHCHHTQYGSAFPPQREVEAPVFACTDAALKMLVPLPQMKSGWWQPVERPFSHRPV